MAIPAKVLSFIAKEAADLIGKSSPSLRSFPKTSYDENAKSLWRGIRSQDQFDVTESGDLVLNPGKNFSGKTTGISFTNDPEVAWSYANRQPESPVPFPQGIVVRVRRDLFEDVDDLLEPGYKNKKPRLKNEDIEGEEAYYTDKPFVVPAGFWSVQKSDVNNFKKAEKAYENQIKSYFEMEDEEFIKKFSRELEDMELSEYQGGVDVFGFDYEKAKADSAKAGDAVNQILYWLTSGDNRFAMGTALRAKLIANPSKEYADRLNNIANEMPITGLYGPDWLFD